MIPIENTLKTYLEAFNILDSMEIQAFLSLVEKKTIEKGGFFIKEGKICNEVAFITSGLLRSFYYSSTLEEVTYCFSFSNSFLAAYSSFISGAATAENIEALTEVEILSISKASVIDLQESSQNWLKFFKVIAEQEYIKMEKRIFLLQKETAERRYHDLMENQPDLLQKIPLNYLSSYLGITQRHLSRIRKSFVY